MTVAEATPEIELARPTAATVAFLGHPKGLGYLAFAEAWERFSYYGMQTLLVLYMRNYLLAARPYGAMSPGFGRSAPRSRASTGRSSPQALASAIFGLYAGLVYLTPILGGFIADRLAGPTRTRDPRRAADGARPFPDGVRSQLPVRLALPAARRRLLQGQYRDPGRRALWRRTTCAAPTPSRSSCICSQRRGDRLAAGLRHARAEGGLALGLRRGRRRHADRPCRLSVRPALAAAPRPGRKARGAATRLPVRRWCKGEGAKIVVLVLLLPLLMLSALGNQEIFNAYLVWGDANFNLVFFGQTMPVTWLISLDAFISTRDDLPLARCSGAGGRSAGPSPTKSPSSPSAPFIAALAPLALAIAVLAGGRDRRTRSASAGASPSTSSTISASPTSSRSASRSIRAPRPRAVAGDDDRRLLSPSLRRQHAGRPARRLPRADGGRPLLADARRPRRRRRHRPARSSAPSPAASSRRARRRRRPGAAAPA